MKLATVLRETETAKTVALLVQQAYEDVLDWHLELRQVHGLIYGELIMRNGQPHGDVIVFADPAQLYFLNPDDLRDLLRRIHEPDAIVDIHSWLFDNSIGDYRIPQPVTREWAEKFVRDFIR